MKTITTILLSLLTLISYSQTKLDLEVFKIINEYRVSNGLKKLIWSTEAFVVTETHNNYMVKAGKLCHGEPIDVPMRQVKCYNCEEEGHIQRDCPHPRKVTCYACKEEGHIQRNCPQRR